MSSRLDPYTARAFPQFVAEIAGLHEEKFIAVDRDEKFIAVDKDNQAVTVVSLKSLVGGENDWSLSKAGVQNFQYNDGLTKRDPRNYGVRSPAIVLSDLFKGSNIYVTNAYAWPWGRDRVEQCGFFDAGHHLPNRVLVVRSTKTVLEEEVKLVLLSPAEAERVRQLMDGAPAEASSIVLPAGFQRISVWLVNEFGSALAPPLVLGPLPVQALEEGSISTEKKPSEILGSREESGLLHAFMYLAIFDGNGAALRALGPCVESQSMGLKVSGLQQARTGAKCQDSLGVELFRKWYSNMIAKLPDAEETAKLHKKQKFQGGTRLNPMVGPKEWLAARRARRPYSEDMMRFLGLRTLSPRATVTTAVQGERHKLRRRMTQADIDFFQKVKFTDQPLMVQQLQHFQEFRFSPRQIETLYEAFTATVAIKKADLAEIKAKTSSESPVIQLVFPSAVVGTSALEDLKAKLFIDLNAHGARDGEAARRLEAFKEQLTEQREVLVGDGDGDSYSLQFKSAGEVLKRLDDWAASDGVFLSFGVGPRMPAPAWVEQTEVPESNSLLRCHKNRLWGPCVALGPLRGSGAPFARSGLGRTVPDMRVSGQTPA